MALVVVAFFPAYRGEYLGVNREGEYLLMLRAEVVSGLRELEIDTMQAAQDKMQGLAQTIEQIEEKMQEKEECIPDL